MKLKTIAAVLLAVPLFAPLLAHAATPDIERLITAATPGLVAIRHDIHQHPELGNREFRTSKLVAERLRKLGLEVRTGIAHTGVVGVLKGALPGPVIGLRAELDALPVTEQTGLSYASTVKAEYGGKQVGVAHVCGHDVHTTILLGVAEVLAADRKNLRGTVKFIFQPAEEGAPDGEEGGAALMIKQGVLDAPTPEVFFSTHVSLGKSGAISVSRDRTTAGSDGFVARIIGKSTHAAAPWRGIDPVPAAALAILALQTIPSRQSDLSLPPPLISIGKIDAGIRQNIIPGEVRLEGTVRSVTQKQRDDVVAKLERTFKDSAESTGATVDFKVIGPNYPAGANNTALVERLLPALRAASTTGEVRIGAGGYAADDMAEFSRRIPTVGFGLGATPEGVDPATAAGNHSPTFLVDDKVIPVGVRAFVNLIAGYNALPGK